MPGPSEPVLRPAERDRGADPPGALDTSSTTGGGHGRTEARRPAARREVGRLPSDRRCPGEVAFPGLAMIGTVEGRTERGGETSRERRYHLGPARLDAAAVAPPFPGPGGPPPR